MNDEDGVVRAEVEPEDTERTDAQITRRHATVEWLSGYGAGQRRGVSDVLDSLSTVLREVGLTEDEVTGVSRKILDRSGLHALFQ